MKIRLARDEDYATIARLHRQTIRTINSKHYSKHQVNVWSGRSTAQRFRNSAHKCKRWVAVTNHKIVGFCDHGFDGELSGLYVHTDFIGKRVGSRLLSTAEKSLQKSGCKKITVKSTITAKKFYQKHGYRVIKKSFHPIHDKKLDIFILVKKLT